MARDGVAIVTGAARGLGLAAANRLASRGHRVAVIDVDGAALDAAALGHRKRWGQSGGKRMVAIYRTLSLGR